MWTVITPLLGTLLGYAARHLVGKARWQSVIQFAKAIMEDPQKTNDPRQAVIEAMIKANLDRVVEGTKEVERAFRPNGIH